MVRSKQNRFYAIALLAIVLLTVALRLYGIEWGLPTNAHADYSYHPDERYTLLWADWLATGEIIAKHFIYGGTLFYTILNLYNKLGSLLHGVLGGDNVLADSILIGRYVNVLVAASTVWLLYESGRLLFSRPVGLIAALLLALAPAHVIYAQVVRPDEIGVLLVTVAVYFAARIFAGANVSIKRVPLYLGLLAGTFLAYRFPLVLFVTLPGLALFFHLHDKMSAANAVRWMATRIPLAVLIMVVTYIFLSPHSVLYFSDAIEGLKVTYRYESNIFLDAYQNGLLAYQHLVVALPQAFGYGAFVIGVGGIGYALYKRTAIDAALLCTALLYAALVVNASWVVVRYGLPLLPIVALFGARAVVDGWHKTNPMALRAVTMVSLVAALVWSFMVTFAFIRVEASPNVREIAAEWIERNLPENASVMLAHSYVDDDFFNPILSDRFHQNYMLLNQHNDSANILRGRRFDYVVLHEIIYASLDRLGERYPHVLQREFYRALNDGSYVLEREFKLPIQFAGIDFSGAFTVNDYVIVNPGIRIYRRVSPGR